MRICNLIPGLKGLIELLEWSSYCHFKDKAQKSTSNGDNLLLFFILAAVCLCSFN